MKLENWLCFENSDRAKSFNLFNLKTEHNNSTEWIHGSIGGGLFFSGTAERMLGGYRGV